MLDLPGARRFGRHRPTPAVARCERRRAPWFRSGPCIRLRVLGDQAFDLSATNWQEVAADPEAAGRAALDAFGPQVDRILVHFDADVLNFLDAPLAEYYFTRDCGLTLDQAALALRALVADPRVSALTITEINPAHGAEDGSTIRRFVQSLADVYGSLGGALSEDHR